MLLIETGGLSHCMSGYGLSTIVRKVVERVQVRLSDQRISVLSYDAPSIVTDCSQAKSRAAGANFKLPVHLNLQ